MNKSEAEARIKILSGEMDANDEENRLYQAEIDQLYKLIDTLKKPAVTATYMDRRGIGRVRTIETLADAKYILNGGYGAREVVLEDLLKHVVGRREKVGGNRWNWYVDEDYFD